MSVEAGTIVDGTVVKILPYGVLVRLPDGETGLVHISEIDDSYIKNVHDFFRLDDTVSVKVLGLNEKGRLELSVRQAGPRKVEDASRHARSDDETAHSEPRPRSQEERQSFDEKMSQFMKQSSERLLDLKRNIEAKRGGKKR